MALSSNSGKLENAEAIGKVCSELEADLAELRTRYEQYFLGNERQAPGHDHEAFRRKLRRLTEAFTNSTVLRFRVQSLKQKAMTYERLWTRTVQEIENGTYRRDVFKAKMHGKEKKPDPTAAAAPASRAPASPAAAPKANGAPAGSLSDAKVRALYDAYVSAKRQCNEDTSKLNMDTLASTLRKQVPELLKKHNAKDVEFKVVIKDGKASLRAFPK